MAKYTPVANSTKSAVYMLKTTAASPADGDWASAGGAAYVNSGWGAIVSLWSTVYNADIYVATQQDTGRVALHVFDPGTDAWTTVDERIADTSDSYFSPATATGAEYGVSIAARSDGDIVAIFAYGNSTNEGRLRAYTRESAVWTDRGEFSTITSTNDSVRPRCIAPASDDRITCITGSTATTTVYQRSVTAANALSTAGNDNSSVLHADKSIGTGGITSGNVVYHPYKAASDSKITVASWTSGDTPTITNTAVGDNVAYGGGAANVITSAVVTDGTNVHLLYIDDTGRDIYYDKNTGGGWGTDTLQVSGTGSINSLSANKINSAIGLIYDDAGTLKFYSLALAAGSTVNSDHQFPANWSGNIPADNQFLAEFMASLLRDGTVLIDNNQGVPPADYLLPLENAQGITADNQAELGWSGVVDRDEQFPAEYTSRAQADLALLPEWSMGLQHSAQYPISHIQGLVIDQSLPCAWSGYLMADRAAQLEWTTGLREDRAAAIEWHTGTFIDSAFPISHAQGVVSDNGVYVGWGGSLAQEYAVRLEWTAALSVDLATPASWNAAIISADYAIPTSWGLGLGLSAVLPLEYRLETNGATYATDFSEYTTGVQPSDWTERWDTGGTWTVETGGAEHIGAQYLKVTAAADARRLLTWNDIDSDSARDDAEVLVRLSTAATVGWQMYVVVRGSGSVGLENGYFVAVNADQVNLGYYLAGASTTIEAKVGAIDHTAGDWFYVRLRAVGTTIQARIWEDGTEEPGNWTFDYTDSNVTGAGWVGVMDFESTGDSYFDWFSVGTGGLAAPEPPATETVRVTAAPVEVLYTDTNPVVRITAAPVEVLYTDTNPIVRVTGVPVEVLYQVINTVASDHPAPISWQAQGQKDHIAPIDWMAALNVSGDAPIEHAAIIQSADAVALEWKAQLQKDHAAPVSWISSIQVDQLAPLEWLSVVNLLAETPMEILAGVAGTGQLPVEIQAALQLNQAAPVEWLALALADQATAVEHLLQLKGDADGRVEWVLQINGVNPIPTEWQGATAIDSDHPFPVTWAGVLDADHAVPFEFSLMLHSDGQTEIEYRVGARTDAALPADWTEGLAADHGTAIDYIKTIDIDFATLLAGWRAIVPADYTTPVEWLAAVTEAAMSVMDWRGTLQHDQDAPAEWVASLLSDHATVPEWTASLFRDAQSPTEWRSSSSTLSSDHAIPVSWLSTASADNTLPVSVYAQLNLHHATAVEWVGTLTRDRAAAIGWRGGLAAEHAAPVSWSGTVHADHSLFPAWSCWFNADHSTGIDWTGGVSDIITILTGWNGSAVQTYALSPEWRGWLDSDLTVSLDWWLTGYTVFVDGLSDAFTWEAALRPAAWSADRYAPIWAIDATPETRWYADPISTTWKANG